MFGWIRRLRGSRWGGSSSSQEHPDVALITFLTEQISAPKRATSVLSVAKGFRRKPRRERRALLPGVYLLLEQYLTDVDPLELYTRSQLRALVEDRFPELKERDDFRIIFEPTPRQEVFLGRALVHHIVEGSVDVFGVTGDHRLLTVRNWLTRIPDEATLPIPLEVADALPATDEAWVELLTAMSRALFEHLEQFLGDAAGRLYEGAYQELARRYIGLESFPVVVRMLPKKLLDEQKIQLLTRDSTLKEIRGELSTARTEALASSAQLQAVLDTVGEGILTVNRSGTIVLANREAHRIFGYPSDELIGEMADRLFHPLLEASSPMPFSRLVHAGDHFGERLEMRGLRADGSTFPVELCIQETTIGEEFFHTAALRDITERKRFQAELIAAKEHAEEMTRLKTAFLNKMSHELRTPLSGIIGSAQILREEVSDEHAEFVQMIEDSGNRLSQTLNGILEFAQLEAEGVALDPEPVDVEQLLTVSVQQLRHRAEDEGLVLHVECVPPELSVEVDARCLERVTRILVDNAIKFTEHGSVTVRAYARSADVLVLTVEDTGIGISPAFMPHLFDEFKQESDGLSRNYEGSGLGLTIAQKLVERMGGTISAESERGMGSRFTVELPSHPSVEEARGREVSRGISSA